MELVVHGCLCDRVLCMMAIVPSYLARPICGWAKAEHKQVSLTESGLLFAGQVSLHYHLRQAATDMIMA